MAEPKAWAMIHPDKPSVILKIEHDPITVRFMKEENANCRFMPLYTQPELSWLQEIPFEDLEYAVACLTDEQRDTLRKFLFPK